MPNPSELARQEYDRAAPTTEGEIGPVLTPDDIEQRAQRDVDEFDAGLQMPPSSDGAYEKKLEALINEHSMENCSDTPDFILARYLRLQLDIFDNTIRRREHWYGRRAGVMQHG
jgi:hypothetical protein